MRDQERASCFGWLVTTDYLPGIDCCILVSLILHAAAYATRWRRRIISCSNAGPILKSGSGFFLGCGSDAHHWNGLRKPPGYYGWQWARAGEQNCSNSHLRTVYEAWMLRNECCFGRNLGHPNSDRIAQKIIDIVIYRAWSVPVLKHHVGDLMID